jgi:nitrogenase molybdenum-iron protein NifN
VIIPEPAKSESFTASRNACKMCTPLGACLAFSGVEGCVPFLHGSQGCATYIRRYLISHFREPMDIASSNFGEHAAIFGGQTNLNQGLANVIRSYEPAVIGIATTCLSETIGDDLPMFIHQFVKQYADPTPLPHLVHASTPSYKGSHFDGYVEAVLSLAKTLAQDGEKQDGLINIIPGVVSPADLRLLKDIIADFELDGIMLPDYSERMDGVSWDAYQRIPEGGTPVSRIAMMGSASGSIEFATTHHKSQTAGEYLSSAFGVTNHRMDMPIGIAATDKFYDVLEQLSGKPTPQRYVKERGRLVDSYVDGHKYCFGKRAILYGEEDFVIAMAGFLSEFGVIPALVASGGKSGKLQESVERVVPDPGVCTIMDGVDFEDITDAAMDMHADLLIGNSKGYKLSQKLGIPLVRIGLPIHDRIGAARIVHLGYQGTQTLYDLIVNTLLDVKQNTSEVGYTYI